MDFSKIDDVRFEINKENDKEMNTNVRVYATEEMFNKMSKDETLKQARNASTLPGIVGKVLVMPDGHEGYGFPVGGVVAFDADEGIISPGAIGFDINCGVRLIKTNLTEKDVRPKLPKLMDSLFANIPSGVGSKFKIGFTRADLQKVAEEGAEYVIKKGFGISEDLERMEENGRMEGADISKVSSSAIKRGLEGLGTLGAGNHFVEVQKVEKVFDVKTAEKYGLSEGQIVIMVHTGSRGFGHQICSDYLMKLVDYQKQNNIKLVDPELSYAHLKSKEAQDYIKAMKCAVNFAFSNREVITDSIRKSFVNIFGGSSDSLGIELLYDVAHNIAKIEEHSVEGKRVKVCVHRKGATRAFAKGRIEVPKIYRDYGQPVIIPGSMGTASYILAGDVGAMQETFGSTCHGSGRLMSRHQAIREISSSKTFSEMEKNDIEVRVKTKKLISEEAQWAYKDVNEVVNVVERAGISRIITKNIPIGVAKG
jgi:tRNA-splicing ligase RtcB